MTVVAARSNELNCLKSLSGTEKGADPAMDGRNWFVYASNDPAGRVDPLGKRSWWDDMLEVWAAIKMTTRVVGVGLGPSLAFSAATMAVTARTPAEITAAARMALWAVAITSGGVRVGNSPLSGAFWVVTLAHGLFWFWIKKATAEAAVGGKTLTSKAVGAAYYYSIVVAGYILWGLVEEANDE